MMKSGMHALFVLVVSFFVTASVSSTVYGGVAEPYYLVSSGSGAIHRYSLQGEYISDLVAAGTNQLGNPQHMVVRNGKVYVPGYTSNSLAQIDLKTGAIENQWTLDGARGTAFVRESTDGKELWVSSITSSRILRVNPETGAVIGDLITPGLIPGAHGIINGPNDTLLVAASDRKIYQINSSRDSAEVFLNVPASPRPTNMLMLDDNTMLVSAFATNTTRSLRTYDLTTGLDTGAFSATQRRQADGLIRADNGEILAVFWGSNAIGRYNDEGEFLGYLIAPGSGLSQPNHIVMVPSPASASLIAPAGLIMTRRRRPALTPSPSPSPTGRIDSRS